MNSKIVDQYGNSIRKTQETPNLDPGFWILSNNDKTTLNDVLNEPYQYHVWVFAAIRSIARNVSQVIHNLSDKRSEQIISDHAILSLLEKPNKIMTQKIFIQTIVSYLTINPTRNTSTGGQCFIIPWNTSESRPVQIGKGEIPDELMPFNDSWFTPAFKKQSVSGMRDVIGWNFEMPGYPDSKQFFANDEVIRINMLNPYDALKGMSAFNCVRQAIELDALADMYNNSNFKNDGRLDGAFTSDSDTLDPTMLNDIKETYYKEMTGPQRKKVMFLSGGMKYQQFAQSAMEMGYLDQQKWSRQKVLGAYGLNRIAVGDYEDINFATLREGRRMLWYDTYIPTDEIIVDALNYQWINNIEKGKYKLTSDYSHIPALSSDMKDRAQIGGELCTKMGYPPTLASRIAGIQLKEEDIKKWPHLDEQLVENQVTPEVKVIEENYETKEIDYYVKNVLLPVDKKFKAELDKYFFRQRNIILNNIDSKVKNKSIEQIAKEIDVKSWELLPDETRETQILAEIYVGATKVQVALEKKQVEKELGRDIIWDIGGTRVNYWTSIRSKYLKDINTHTFNVARDAIEETTREALTEGLTVTEFQKKIKSAVNEVYEVRVGRPVVAHGNFDLGGMSSSKTIARTEMGTIASLTRNDIFKTEGIQKIKWVTASDEKVRETHSSQNGKIIALGDRFSNGLKFPRDPDGSAGEIINCRCSYSAVFD